MDYEDDIGAKVKNVGTGPLIITRLYFRELDINTKEYSVLLDIMPKIAQYWATYVECVDGWTIPIGGEIVLIELHPENDYIKDLVRKSLTKITAYIEYTDIYGTQFHILQENTEYISTYSHKRRMSRMVERILQEEHSGAKLIVVSLDETYRVFNDVEVMPATYFLHELWKGNIYG